MRLLIWLWERSGTELFVTDGCWDWDEWHSFWFGWFEATSEHSMDELPMFVYLEECYYIMGRSLAHTLGRRARMIGDCLCFLITGLLFIGGLYLIGDLVTYFLAKGLMQ